MTIPLRFKSNKRGYYTDNDEPERRRAHDVAAMDKAYKEGGAQSDYATKFDPGADYKTLSRIRRAPAPSTMKRVVQSYSDLIRKKRP